MGGSGEIKGKDGNSLDGIPENGAERVPLLPELGPVNGNQSIFGEPSAIGHRIIAEIDAAIELPLLNDSKAGFSRVPGSGFTKSDATRVVDSPSGIFSRPQRSTEPRQNDGNRTSPPLGLKRSTPDLGEVDGSQSYLRSKAMQAIRDSADPALKMPTDQYIETEVDGGIQTLIHMLRMYLSAKSPFSQFEINGLIRKYKNSEISAGTLSQMRLEITNFEAQNRLLTDSQIAQLTRVKVVSDDSLKTNGRPLEYKSSDGKKFILRHHDNLILINLPNPSLNGLDSWSSFYFRVDNRRASLVRVDEVKKGKTHREIASFLLLLKADEKRFALFLNK